MLDEYDEHYSGLYIVGENDDLVFNEQPPLINAPSSVSGGAENIDVLSNKTANNGFFALGGGSTTPGNQDNKRSFSPAFKI